MHLFWLALVIPAVILLQWVLPVFKNRSIWSTSFMIIGLSTIVWLTMGLITLNTDQQNVRGITAMVAFRLIASTELPLIQLMAGCGVGWFRSSGRHEISKPEPDSGATANLPALD